MVIRTAGPTDLDNITDLAFAVLPEVPQYSYRFSYAKDYPDDQRKYLRIQLEQYLKPDSDDYHVMVVEAPSLSRPDSIQIVALAVWDLSSINMRKYGVDYRSQDPAPEVNKAGGSTRKDVDPQRLVLFLDAVTKLKECHIDAAKGADQIYLRILAVHPDYRHHGFASALVKWGILEARDTGAVVGLIASPPTSDFYSRLGFKSVGEETLQVKDDPEKVLMQAMSLELQ